MKKYIFLFLLSLFFICNIGVAQDTIGISKYTYFIAHDTIGAGATDSVSIWVVNRGRTNFNHLLKIYTSVQDTASFLYHEVDSVNLGIVSIPGQDSIPLTLYPHYIISPVEYHYDINVIVIWPVASVISNCDSLHYDEMITISSGINEIDLNKYIKAYPNPSVDYLTLENNSKIAIEEVRIYDSKGQLINTLNQPGIIDTENWSKGIYLLEIYLKNKQIQTIKVVKQ